MPEESIKSKDKDVKAPEGAKKSPDTDEEASVVQVGPSATTPDHTPLPWANLQSKSRRSKGLVIAAVVTAIVFVLGVGGWMTYALWYQNPDKVVMDAIVNAIRSDTVALKGSIATKSSNQSFTTEIDAKYSHQDGAIGSAKMVYEASGIKLNIDASGIQMPNGDNFVRIKDAAKVYSHFGDALINGAQIDQDTSNYSVLKSFFDSILKPTAEKIDNKWIKFSVKDLKKVNAQLAEQFECSQSVFKKLKDNTDQLIELGVVYQNNKFLEVKKNLGNSDNYFRFEVGIINNKFKDFAEALTKTKVYKELQTCSSAGKNPLDLDTSAFTESTGATAEVWIDQWTHTLHKISTDSVIGTENAKGTLTSSLTTKFNDKVTVTAPKDGVISFDDAFSEINDYIGNIFRIGTRAGQSSI